jgi:hypothetical protein
VAPSEGLGLAPLSLAPVPPGDNSIVTQAAGTGDAAIDASRASIVDFYVRLGELEFRELL